MQNSLREVFAVTGYVPDADAGSLRKGASGYVEVQPERKSSEVRMRVRGEDVAEVRVGSSEGGHTLVQQLLRENAAVETVLRAQATHDGVSRFADPALQRLAAAATAKVIMV